MSSRKLIVYLDGLPDDCWYKLSVHRFIKEAQEYEERKYVTDVGGLIFAQLSGQVVS